MVRNLVRYRVNRVFATLTIGEVFRRVRYVRRRPPPCAQPRNISTTCNATGTEHPAPMSYARHAVITLNEVGLKFVCEQYFVE